MKSWRHVSRAVKLLGAVALSSGLLIHGFFRDPNNSNDKQWMILGTETAVVGFVLLVLGTVLRKFDRSEAEYRDEP